MSQEMNKKQKLIAEMIEMQRKFIEYDREYGMQQEAYWLSEENHPLSNYRQNYAEKATEVVNLAHQDKGSKR